MDVGAQPPTARLAPRLFAAVKAQRGSRRRWIVAAAVALALVAVTAFAVTKFRTPVNTVAASDTTVLSPTSLRSSVSATGTVASANSFKVYSNLTYAVRYIHVSVGQTVAAGDPLCDLDTASLDKQVSAKTATMDQAEGVSAAAIQAAQDKYEAARSSLANGTNAAVANANSAVTNAYNAWVKAQQASDDYAATLNADQNSQLLPLKAALDNADNALSTARYSARKAASDRFVAEEQLDSAWHAYRTAKEAVDTATPPTAGQLEALATAEAALQAAKMAFNTAQDVSRRADLALQSAETVRDNADDQYAAALAGADTTLADLYRAADAAYDSYVNALASLDATTTAAGTEIRLALDALRSSEASASNTAALQDLANLSQDLDATTVAAPIEGTVTAVYANVGANPAGLVFVIEDTTRLRVESSVKEFDVVSVKEGMAVTIESDATRDAVYQGRITSIAPASGKDPAGKTITGSDIQFATKVDVLSAKTDLRIGMNVRLNYILAQQDGVLVVPFDAVFTTARGGTAVLGVAKDARGRAVLQEFPVVTGLSNDLNVVLTGRGITEGLRVINSPTKHAAGDVVTIAG